MYRWIQSSFTMQYYTTLELWLEVKRTGMVAISYITL